MNRSRLSFPTPGSRCDEASTYVKTDANSPCAFGYTAIGGGQKVLNAETSGLRHDMISSGMSAVSSSEYLRSALNKRARCVESRWNHSCLKTGPPPNDAPLRRRIPRNSCEGFPFPSSTPWSNCRMRWPDVEAPNYNSLPQRFVAARKYYAFLNLKGFIWGRPSRDPSETADVPGYLGNSWTPVQLK